MSHEFNWRLHLLEFETSELLVICFFRDIVALELLHRSEHPRRRVLHMPAGLIPSAAV